MSANISPPTVFFWIHFLLCEVKATKTIRIRETFGLCLNDKRCQCDAQCCLKSRRGGSSSHTLHTHFMLVLQHVSGEICVVFVLDKLCGVSITAMNMNMEFILKQSAAAFSLLHPQVCTSVRAAESHKLLHTYWAHSEGICHHLAFFGFVFLVWRHTGLVTQRTLSSFGKVDGGSHGTLYLEYICQVGRRINASCINWGSREVLVRCRSPFPDRFERQGTSTYEQRYGPDCETHKPQMSTLENCWTILDATADLLPSVTDQPLSFCWQCAR